MLFKKNFALLVLAMTLSGSVKAADADAKETNSFQELINAAKQLVGPIAYGVSNQAFTKNVQNPYLRATIDASVALGAIGLKNQFTTKKNVSFKNKIKEIVFDASKAFMILATDKYGIPFADSAFARLNLPQMLDNNNRVIYLQKAAVIYLAMLRAAEYVKKQI